MLDYFDTSPYQHDRLLWSEKCICLNDPHYRRMHDKWLNVQELVEWVLCMNNSSQGDKWQRNFCVQILGRVVQDMRVELAERAAGLLKVSEDEEKMFRGWIEEAQHTCTCTPTPVGFQHENLSEGDKAYVLRDCLCNWDHGAVERARAAYGWLHGIEFIAEDDVEQARVAMDLMKQATNDLENRLAARARELLAVADMQRNLQRTET
ncbi:hypothetical protein LTR17_012016 [Elasticomyces elasticus]|nr:hypothetical protein LTR17_012016 [Elasticomyces elasticus]